MKRLADLLLVGVALTAANAVLDALAKRKPKGWDVLDLKRHVHVVPLDDDIEHDTDSLDCICGPAIEFHERPLVTHASLDGREAHAG